jgi:cobalt-precorrin-7 (C5)-methyltransferase
MITCVSVGPGDLGFLTQRGAELFKSADLVAGFDSVVKLVQDIVSPSAQIVTMSYSNQVAKLAEVANAHHSGKHCIVAFMGDVHFSGFQFLERVEKACGHPVDTLPGISSAQVLASRCKVCFDETTFITFHRRGDIEPFKRHLVNVLTDGRNAIVIPRPWDFMPKDITSYLIESGIPRNHPTEVWENLTQKESEWKGYLGECQHDFTDMSIMLIRALVPMPSQLETK